MGGRQTMQFCQLLQVPRGVTAIIGSGGKTTLLYLLARELSHTGSVIVTTTTHIFPPDGLPWTETVRDVRGIAVVGTPCEDGKLTAPRQSFAALAELADYVLVEADGSRRLPLKAHAPYEPVLPPNTAQVITVVGASGLNRPIAEVVHRPERFTELSGEAELATPQAVAAVLIAEGLTRRVVINQADLPGQLSPALELKSLLPFPTVVAALNKEELLCSY